MLTMQLNVNNHPFEYEGFKLQFNISENGEITVNLNINNCFVAEITDFLKPETMKQLEPMVGEMLIEMNEKYQKKLGNVFE